MNAKHELIPTPWAESLTVPGVTLTEEFRYIFYENNLLLDMHVKQRAKTFLGKHLGVRA
jgi:hypothetical protein